MGTSSKKKNGESSNAGRLFSILSEKLNNVGKMAQEALYNLQILAQRQKLHEQVLERLDINNATLTEVLKEVFGRFEQFEAYLEQISQTTEWSPQELTPEKIRQQANERFEALLEESFRRVLEARQEKIEQERKEAEKRRQEQEAETAEKTLQGAEEASRNISETPGGEGSEIPDGAEIFGD